MPISRFARSLSLLLLATLAPPASLARQDDDEAKDAAVPGLHYRLTERPAPRPAAPPSSAPPVERLSDARTARALARIPPIREEPSDAKAFALRPSTLKPPPVGGAVLDAFPPTSDAVAPPVVVPGPLRVLRHAPDGPVPLAPGLSVTFSQPMVAHDSHEDLAAVAPPANISPLPPGEWRWTDARTAVFRTDARLPAATAYTVEVPAGTRSATGGALAEAARWTFETPPPALVGSTPGHDETSARPPKTISLRFDQRVDAAAVVPHVKVTAEGRSYALTNPLPRVADTTVSFDLVDPLPLDALVVVTIGAGTPSAEGPLVTRAEQARSFRTYGPLRVVSTQCGLPERCLPGAGLQIAFDNVLDATAFDASQVRVSPEIPNAKVSVAWREMRIDGATAPSTTYTVTLDGSLRDEFGQTLGEPVSLQFVIPPLGSAVEMPGSMLVVLDPAQPATFPVVSVNCPELTIRLYAVTLADWDAYNALLEHPKQPPPDRPLECLEGRLVSTAKLAPGGAANEPVVTTIDLRPALRDGLGHIVVEAEYVGSGGWSYRTARWLEATRIGIDAFSDAEELVAWTTSLVDGAPLANVEVSLVGISDSAATGADGTARLALTREGSNVLVARAGPDVAFLPRTVGPYYQDLWRKYVIGDDPVWFVFDGRGLYRPGDTARVKGWVRRVGFEKGGDVEAVGDAATKLEYRLKDEGGNEIEKGEAPLDRFGGFDLSLALPPNAGLGTAELELQAKDAEGDDFGSSYRHDLRIEEYRRPDFEVKVEAGEGPYFVGDHADATATASYYSGGGLADAEVEWTATSYPGGFTPPNRDDFAFGEWTPWWEERNASDSRERSLDGRTDANGVHSVRVDFDRLDPPHATVVNFTASVEDVNRQRWVGGKTVLVHPASLYVGLRARRTFVERGVPFAVDAIVTDLDGKAVAGRRITLRVAREDSVFEAGEWKHVESDVRESRASSALDPAPLAFTPSEGGVYRLDATIEDDLGRKNGTTLTFWVAGAPLVRRSNEALEVGLIPDRRDYRAGDVAELLVNAPFWPAEGTMRVNRSGIVRFERFRVEGPTATLKIPIEEGYVPNVEVRVTIEGKADGRPSVASGKIGLSVPPVARTLSVRATPRASQLVPGGNTTLDVSVRDASGRPLAGGQVAAIVVDESVLALAGYSLEDPVRAIYGERPGGVDDRHLRALLIPNDVAALLAAARSNAEYLKALPLESRNALQLIQLTPGITDSGEVSSCVTVTASKEIGRAPDPAKLRTNFDALALFAPRARTDASGHARIALTLPDTLTRYRVMVVATDGARRFGAGESVVTAGLPLTIRPSPPRFLNYGDRFELSAVVQNRTARPLAVDVAARAGNADLTEGAGRRVVVPANGRAEVRIPAAARSAGTARFRLVAVSGALSDAAEVELPVWTPATTEAFATYGEVDDGAIAQPVVAPRDVVPDFGGLRISTSSTQLGGLVDAIRYLDTYPYGCSEQISSKVIADVAMRDVGAAFGVAGFVDPAALKAKVEGGLKTLAARQDYSGSVGLWGPSETDSPFVSIHAAHAFAVAKAAGYDVRNDAIEHSTSYLRGIDSHIPKTYGVELNRSIRAYALSILALLGAPDPAAARALVAEAGLENLPLEAVGWLLPTLAKDPGSAREVAAIRTLLANRVEETAGQAHFVTSYGEDAYLVMASDLRTDAVLLDALLGDDPSSDLVPKLARGLLAHRRRSGCWYTTQENLFSLLALGRYFSAFEKATPDFTARAWLGDRLAVEQPFRGRSTVRHETDVPMAEVAKGPERQSLVIAKDGPGRLYYRVGLSYAPASLDLAPLARGFAVSRRYEAVDDSRDVRRDADGTWHVKTGARVRVRVVMVAPGRRTYVALVDPLPGGFEILNPDLAVVEEIPDDPEQKHERDWWRRHAWFDNENLRDDRAEAFRTLLSAGEYEYGYVVRATTSGRFVVPPSKAEEMYEPETFGRGASDRVVVEP